MALLAFFEHHGHQHAAVAAEQELCGLRSLPVTAENIRTKHVDDQLSRRVRYPRGAMRAAEAAIAGARCRVGGDEGRGEVHGDRAAVAAAVQSR